MNIPMLLHGNYNDVFKKVRKLKKICKDDTDLISFHIEELEERNVRQDELIVMLDGYISRSIKCSYFPFVFPSVFLFEKGIDSPIVKWYKEKALEKPWLLLSLIADCYSTMRLFDKNYSIKVLNSLMKFWTDLTSVGSIYINDIVHCLATKSTIEIGDGLHLWEKSLMFKRILLKAGFNKEDLNSDEDVLNILNIYMQSYEKNKANEVKVL